MSSIETRSKKLQSQDKGSTEESGSSSKTEQTTSTERTSSTEQTTSTEETMNAAQTSGTAKKVLSADANTNASRRRTRRGSQASTSKRAELEARLELQKKQIAKAEAEAALARTTLELAQLVEDSDIEENTDQLDEVNDWISRTPAQPAHTNESDKQIDILVKVLSRALKTNDRENTPKKPPSYMSELPPFDGDPTNWIPFYKHYTSTAEYFIDIENIARIRKALKGQGKEAVKSLLYTSSSPENIIKELERRFGQPTYIIKGLITELHKLPRMSEDLKGIGTFASAVFNTVDTIKQLDQQEYLYSTEIVDKITDKMNALVKFRWQEFKANRRKEPMLNVLSDFLIKISNDFDEPGPSEKPSQKRTEHNKNHPFRKTRVNVAQHDSGSDSDASYDSEFEEEMKFVLAASTTEIDKCVVYKQQHEISKCTQFLKESVQDRWETMKRLNACFKCLRTDHRHITCSTKPCGKEGCTRNHHELLHRDKYEPHRIASVNHTGMSKVYLKIIPVELTGPYGTTTVMALLDEGSTVTLLLDEVADRIGATGPSESLLIEGIGGHQINTKSRHIKLRVKGLLSRNYEDLQARTINHLSLRSQSVTKEDINEYMHLKQIEDQLLYNGSPPTLLIGQDNWHLIVTRDIKVGNPSEPVASLTSLGWILHGCIPETSKPVLYVNHIFEKEADNNDEQIRDQLNLNSLNTKQKKPTNDPEQRALDILETNTYKLPEGKLECGLLRHTDRQTMPLNIDKAARHLKAIKKTLSNKQYYKNKYNKEIRKLLTNRYAEPTTNKTALQKTRYLPRFAVIHPKRKIRVLFNNAKRIKRKHLSDAPLSGPDQLQPLFSDPIKFRFRQTPIAVAASIKNKFRTIENHEEDRDLRFLKKNNKTNNEPRECHTKPPVFDTASSPYVAVYVENKDTPLDDHGSIDSNESTLRMLCNTSGDALESTLNLRNTREGVFKILRPPIIIDDASAVKSVFDPLGIATPVFIQENKSIKQLWHDGLEWEPNQTIQNWTQWLKSLDCLETIDNAIKRRHCLSSSRTVLSWIKSDQRTYKTFAIHWLTIIEKLCNLSDRRHVSTKPNTANDTNRLTPGNYDINLRWFNDPQKWLTDHKKRPLSSTGDKKQPSTSTSIRFAITLILEVDRYSLWTRSIRDMARFPQAIDCLKSFIQKTKTIKIIKRISRNTKWKFTKANKENRRKIARQGTPKYIYSNNKISFIGANNETKSEFDKMVEKTDEKGILWKFVPPGPPHMGGSSKRPVRSVITASTAALDTPHVTTQHSTDYFWKHCLIEHFPIITPKYNNQGKFVSPAEGDKVIIVDNSLPRGTWPKSEIVKTAPDEIIRIVHVCTSAEILRRPSSRQIKVTQSSTSE